MPGIHAERDHHQKNPCLPVIERAGWQKQHRAEHDKLNKPEYQQFRNGFHGSSLPFIRYRTLTTHIAVPDSRYSQLYSAASIDRDHDSKHDAEPDQSRVRSDKRFALVSPIGAEVLMVLAKFLLPSA